MLKLPPDRLAEIEADYPGFLKSLARFESLDLPPCDQCGSADTAAVQAGFVGRTIKLTQATSKFHLTPNGSPKGSLWCKHPSEVFRSLGTMRAGAIWGSESCRVITDQRTGMGTLDHLNS
jgi:hypothetical protein